MMEMIRRMNAILFCKGLVLPILTILPIILYTARMEEFIGKAVSFFNTTMNTHGDHP